MKKLILLSIAAAISIMLCSCGDPAPKNNNENYTNNGKSTTVSVKSNSQKTSKKTTAIDFNAKSQTRQTYPIHTEKTGKYDNLSELSGTYIEAINGKKENYVFVNSLGTSFVKIGSKIPTPIEIDTSDKGIMIIRGSKTPVDDYSPYTFNGKTLKFTFNEDNYVWTKIDKLDIKGGYYLIENGDSVEKWSFQEGNKLTVTTTDGNKNYTFKQSADKIVLTDDSGKNTTYNYIFDEFTLRMTNKNENLYFRTME